MRKRIKRLINVLDSLPHSEFPDKCNLKSDFYPFSNERGLQVPFEILTKRAPNIYRSGTIRIAILIGQSSFCSLLPALSRHCDLIVFTDINPLLIQHTRKLLSLLQISINRKDFERRYNAEKGNFLPNFFASQATPDLELRKKALGNYHFLYNDVRFSAAQSAALTVKFAFCHINLFHKDDRKKFFKIFKERKCTITFFNATNLYEWDAPTPLALLDSRADWKPLSTVKKIFNELESYYPIIMFSTRENCTELCPLKAELCFSYMQYLKHNQNAVRKYLDLKFPLPGINPNFSGKTSDQFTPQFRLLKVRTPFLQTAPLPLQHTWEPSLQPTIGAPQLVWSPRFVR